MTGPEVDVTAQETHAGGGRTAGWVLVGAGLALGVAGWLTGQAVYGVLLAIICIVPGAILLGRSASRGRVAAAPGPAVRAVQPVAGTNGFAVTALILGLVGLSLLAIVFGHIALSQTRRTGQGGRGMAIAGTILGYVGLLVSAFVIVLVMSGGDFAFNNG